VKAGFSVHHLVKDMLKRFWNAYLYDAFLRNLSSKVRKQSSRTFCSSGEDTSVFDQCQTAVCLICVYRKGLYVTGLF
jgi:hypothetical protein